MTQPVKLEVRTIKCFLSDASSLEPLTFDQPVGSLLYGISGFLLIYPEYDVWTGPSGWVQDNKITKFQVSLSFTTISNADGSLAYVPNVVACMKSNNDDQPDIDLESSWVYFTVIAITGDNTSSVAKLGNIGLIEAGEEVEVGIPSDAQGNALLAGCEFVFGTNEEDVSSVQADTALSDGVVTPSGSMQNTSGSSNTSKIDAGYIAALKSSPGFRTTVATSKQTSDSFTINMGDGPYSACAAIITRFQAEFEGNNEHGLSYIGAGLVSGSSYNETRYPTALPDDPEIVNGSSVSVPYGQVLMGSSGNGNGKPKTQDNSNGLSSVDLTIIAISQ